MGSGACDGTAGPLPAFRILTGRLRRPAAAAPPPVQMLRAALISPMIASSGRAGRGAGVAG